MAEGGVSGNGIDEGSPWMLSSDEFCDLFCQSCSNIGTCVPAQGFCIDCGEYFCGKCCLEHRKFNITKNHVIKAKDEMPRDKIKTHVDMGYTFTDKCASHTEEYIKYMCQACDQIGCSVCMTTSHRSCETVTYIPDIIGKQNLDKEIASADKRVNEFLMELSEDGAEILANKEAVGRYKAAALNELDNARKRINRHFDNLEKRFRNEVDIVHSEDERNITHSVEEHEALENELVKIRSSLEDRKDGTVIQKFVATKHAGSMLKQAGIRLADLRKKNKARRYIFSPSSQNIQMIENINKLGNLMFTRHRTRRATFLHGIDIALEQELGNGEKSKGCTIQGIEILSESRLMVTDSYCYSVKVISIVKKKPISSLKMHSWPFAITKINEDSVAVTLPALKQIQIVQIKEDDTMKVVKEIERGKVCCGVMYNRGKLFVTYSHPQVKLEIIDLSGRVIKVFSNEHKGDGLFERPFYIAVNLTHDTVCISDVQKNSLTFLSLDGEYRNSFCERKKIYAIRGIAMDSEGVAYACAFDSHEVYQFADDGSKLRILLGEDAGLKNPQALKYCTRSDRLFVGMDGGNIVKVFSVKT